MPEEPDSSPAHPAPAHAPQKFTCPDCQVTLMAELPEGEATIVCPQCDAEFTSLEAMAAPQVSLDKIKPRIQPRKQKTVPATPEKTVAAMPVAAEPAPAPAPETARKAHPRAPQMPGPEMVHYSQTRATSGKEDRQREVNRQLISMVLLGLVLLGGTLTAWYLLYQAQKRERDSITPPVPVAVQPAPSQPAPEDEAVAEAAPSPPPAGMQEVTPTDQSAPTPNPTAPAADTPEGRHAQALAAAEAAGRALAAPTWQELLGRVRAPQVVEPLMRAHYAENPYQPVRATSILSADTGTTTEGITLAYVSLQLPDFSAKRIVLERVEGRFLVDWESLVGYQEIPWDQFNREFVRQPTEFRVGIELAPPQPERPERRADDPREQYYEFWVYPGFTATGAASTALMKRTAPGASELYTRLQTTRRLDAILTMRFIRFPDDQVDTLEITALEQFGWMKGYGQAAPESAPVQREAEAPF